MPYNTLMPIMADEVLGIGAQGFGLTPIIGGHRCAGGGGLP